MGGAGKGKDNFGTLASIWLPPFPSSFLLAGTRCDIGTEGTLSHEVTADRETVNPTNKAEETWFCDSWEYHISPGPPTSGEKKSVTKITFYLVSQLLFSVFYHCSQTYCWYKSECSIWLFLINTIFSGLSFSSFVFFYFIFSLPKE